MELSVEVLKKHNEARKWWEMSVRASEEAENSTLDLVYELLKEVNYVKFDKFWQGIDRPYYDGESWKIGRLKVLYINKDSNIAAVLVDGTETLLEHFEGLCDRSMWDAITDSLGLNEDYN